ncbi:hypothetical protein PSHT_04949 [Puccinia striiformis]|uniref:RRM domain-containing protein n=1 Tax=Puccinia striiformis TaxID=27350 RepID=A0A2S4WBQ7_9BASI|nr:hypothetical protein PSHT_04949 [Puccinia striiformis]
MSVLISDPTRKQTRSDNHADDKEIYITCLSKFTKEEDLRKLFAQFGEIKGVRVVLDQAGHSKGFAFVEFKEEMSAKAALTMNNVELKKRRMGVTISSGKGPSLVRKNVAFKDETKISSAADHRSRSVKVSNIPEGTQEALVQQAFEQFGKDAGQVFLHKEPISINNQKVEVSVPTITLKSGLAASSSFTPLLPRSTVKGKKSRIGLGHSAGPSATKPQEAKDGDNPNAQQNGSNNVPMKDSSQPHSASKAGSKTQDDFRKMLG